MGAVPASKLANLAKEAQKVKGHVDALITKMKKDEHFTPTRDQLEEYAEMLIDFINRNHAKTAPFESHLKAAIIDLTEVPEMHPQMQRIAFQTALKDASQKLGLFISCC